MKALPGRRRKVTKAESVEDALAWIEGNDHHFASAMNPAYFVLRGRATELRVPAAIHDKMGDLVEPSKARFDTRMYRATAKGRRKLRNQTEALHRIKAFPTDGGPLLVDSPMRRLFR